MQHFSKSMGEHLQANNGGNAHTALLELAKDTGTTAIPVTLPNDMQLLDGWEIRSSGEFTIAVTQAADKTFIALGYNRDWELLAASTSHIRTVAAQQTAKRLAEFQRDSFVQNLLGIPASQQELFLTGADPDRGSRVGKVSKPRKKMKRDPHAAAYRELRHREETADSYQQVLEMLLGDRQPEARKVLGVAGGHQPPGLKAADWQRWVEVCVDIPKDRFARRNLLGHFIGNYLRPWVNVARPVTYQGMNMKAVLRETGNGSSRFYYFELQGITPANSAN